ncbi:MAG: hypothetical protein ACJAQ4_002293 [Cryomorphaceae bacterium]|jgi:hypothetical protein
MEWPSEMMDLGRTEHPPDLFLLRGSICLFEWHADEESRV